MPKIDKIDILEVPLKTFKESWGDDSVWPVHPPCFMIRIELSNGIVGHGEVASQTWYLGETSGQIASCLALYATALKGADVRNIAAAHHKMEMAYSGGMPGGRGARSGIDMAMHDALGKLWQVPLATLLGGARRNRLDLMTNLYHKSPEAMAEACREFVGKGFRGLKIKVGDVIWQEGLATTSVQRELSFLDAALDTTPRDIFIDADANQAWRNPGLAAGKLSRYAGRDNLAIEQPLHYANIEGHRDLRTRTNIPLILDESAWSPEAILNLVASKACDRIVLKLNRVGGFYPARQIIGICEAAGIGVSIDTNPYTLLGDSAISHLGAVTLDHYPICCDGHATFLQMPEPGLVTGGVEIKPGYAAVPEQPGIGVEVNWSRITELARYGERGRGSEAR